MAPLYTIICSMCGLEMSTQDEDFHEHVSEVMMID